METILIATDFSTAAQNATRYGFELSKAMKAKVILFNAYNIPKSTAESLPYFSMEENEEISYRQLGTQAETFDPLQTVALETQSRPGPVTNSILEIAAENQVSFIIVGMKSQGKEMRKLFGSTVNYLRRQTTIPIIVVPEKAEFHVPKTVALAFDNSLETGTHVLAPLKKIVEDFKSQLVIVRVIDKLMNEAIEKLMIPYSLKYYLDSLDPRFEIAKHDNVIKALNTFADENNVDLLAVIPHEHNLIERFFSKSITKEMLFHTHVPLLILPNHPNNSAARKSYVLSDHMEALLEM